VGRDAELYMVNNDPPSTRGGGDIIKIVLVLQPYYHILLVILPIVLVLLPLDDGRCRRLRQPRRWPTSRRPRRWPTSMHALDRPPDDTTAPSSPSEFYMVDNDPPYTQGGADIIKIVLVLLPYYNILLVILPIVLVVLLPLDDGRCPQLRQPRRWSTSRRPQRWPTSMHALDRPPKDATVPSSFSARGVVLAAMVAASVSISSSFR